MANEKTPPPNYDERIRGLEETVKKLQAAFEQKQNDETKDELRRRRDTLLHLRNMAKGDINERARKAAETARTITLNRAVQQ